MMVGAGPNVIVKSKYGLIIINRHDKYIGAEIAKTGSWDEENVSLLRQLVDLRLRTKSIVRVYDAGANIGSHTLAIASQFGGRVSIRAFEAQRAIYYMLCGTVALNNLQNVTVHMNAVSSLDGEKIQISVPNYNVQNNFGGFELAPAFKSDNQNMKLSGETIEIETLTIDSFNEDVDIIKIDIEGMEFHALKGAMSTINRSRPIFLVEIMKSRPAEIEEFFVASSYDIFRGRADILAVPKELNIKIR